MDDITIQTTLDAAAIARVHHRTVSVAYREFFPAGSAEPTVEDLTSLWAERLADQTARVMAASISGDFVGTVAVRRDPDFAPEGQLLGLHVLPVSWGQGVGRALHDAALTALATQGYQAAGLWVIAANRRARRMYEKREWVLKPDVELDFLGVREVRYARRM
jgi:ribosomal protein S18 acetylase RimI-like enzyme